MSAEFDDLVARIRALALDEWRGHNPGVYPQPHEIADAEACLLLRLWGACMGAETVGGPYRAPFSEPYFTVDLPGGGAYTARVTSRIAQPADPAIAPLPPLSECEGPVVHGAADEDGEAIASTISAHNKPGRPNDL